MIVAEKTLDFKRLEQKIFELVCGRGREMLKQALEAYDWTLAVERDRTVYRHKGQKPTSTKTIMGTVCYSRAVYLVRNEDGTNSCVYLLDEALGSEVIGQMSGNLTEMVTNAACKSTYREAARSVSEMTGQSISHQAAWNVVQAVGERVEAQEERAAQLAASNKGAGTLEAKLLFEEQDGIWLKLQGESRKKNGASHEMKLGIAYDGAKEVGKDRYELTNKVACANFERAENFQKRMEGAIAQTYNVDEIELRFLNGDGAAWIKQAVTDETVHFQLDPFHRNKAINQYVRNQDMRAEMMRMLYNKDIASLLIYIEACANSVEDDGERENLSSLLTYFQNNKDGLVPCHRRGLALPEPPPGVEYRHLGCMESNIFTVLGNRMKGRRACWSIDGGNNLARLLCLKATNKLSDVLNHITAAVLPAKYAEEITVKMTAAKAPKYDGKGYEPIHAGASPATPDFTFLRELGRIPSLSHTVM